MRSIALLGEFMPTFPPHVATNAAIDHARSSLGVEVRAEWVSTEDIDDSLFERFAGIWVAPGFPYKNPEKTLWAIRYARENGVPCFGTCGGFQHVILEYARNVLGFKNAQHAGYDGEAPDLFISKLACSLAGREMQLRFLPGSKVAAIYGSLTATEQYYCTFGVDPDRVPLLSSGPLTISGSDSEGDVRVVELSGHPYFVATLFVPQARSTPEAPHPLVIAFVRAAGEVAAER